MTTIKYNGHTIVDGVLQLDDLRVKGSLNLTGCTALTALPDGLNVDGSLHLSGCTALTALPNELSVGRCLDLTGCTALTALSDGLSVGGDVDLGGCTGLSALPDGISVGGALYLNDCTALTTLPDGLIIGRWLGIEGCTALTALPDGLSVGEWIFLDNLHLSSNEATLIGVPLAHSIRTAAIDRRLGDLVDHWALSWNGMRVQIIESIEEDEDGELVIALAPHATTTMSANEIDCVMAGADHGDQSQYSLL